MGLLTEEPYIVLAGKIVLLRIKDAGVYAYVDDVVRDETTKNRLGWIVTLSLLIYNTPTQVMKITNEQAKGEEFTIDGDFMQFCTVAFSAEPIKRLLSYPPLRVIKGGKKD